MRTLIALLACCPAIALAAQECAIPLPDAGAQVNDYLMQTNLVDDQSIPAQLHSALYDLVEYSPMGCGDAEPDDTYARFTIRTAERDEADCAWLRLGIVPPGAASDRPPTPVLCSPANERIGGWSCRFLPFESPKSQ